MMKKHPTFAPWKRQCAVCCHATDLDAQMLSKLKVYAGPKHPHAAQKPVELKINPENETLEVAK